MISSIVCIPETSYCPFGPLRNDTMPFDMTCLSSSDNGNEEIGTEFEVVTGTKEEEDPEPIRFQTIKTESEVSFVCV
jgi:hypothetical protein